MIISKALLGNAAPQKDRVRRSQSRSPLFPSNIRFNDPTTPKMQNQSTTVGLNVPTVTNSLLLTMALEQMVYGLLGAIILLYLAKLVWALPGKIWNAIVPPP